MRIGFHYPFSGSLDKLKEKVIISRGNVVHFYIRSLRGIDKNGDPHKIKNVRKKQLENFKEFRKNKNIKPFIMHSPYFYNIAKEIHKNNMNEEFKFTDLILEDLNIAKELECDYYVLHPGYSKDIHPLIAVENIKMNLMEIIEKTEWKGEILIKNMSGAGSEIGYSLKEWNELISFHPRVKGALDFSRAYSAGYDFTNEQESENFIKKIEEEISWEKIKLLYINDINRFCGSRKNNFVPLGEGVIGQYGYSYILNNEIIKEKNWIVENQPDLEHVDDTIEFLTSFFK